MSPFQVLSTIYYVLTTQLHYQVGCRCCPTEGLRIPALTSWSYPGRMRSRLGLAEIPAAFGTRKWGRLCLWCPCSGIFAWAPHPRPCPCPPLAAGIPQLRRGDVGVLSQFSPRPCPAIITKSTTTIVSAHGTSRGDDVWRCNNPRVTFANHVVGVDVICCYL